MPNTSYDITRYFAGETVRFWARDVLDEAGDDVTSGATMLVQLYDPNGDVAVSSSGQADATDPNDWYADINLPDSGMYEVKITLTLDELVWISKEPMYIYP